jgi:GxxExxY protein
MPIDSAIPIACISQQEYHEIDERMVGHAMAIHNQLGRLLDEVVYKKELAERCAKDGMPAHREVRIRVTHRDFVKDYFIDMLLCGSTIVEAKTVKETFAAHKGQGINYLLLAGAHHGSLVNFRPPRLKRHFLSTRLTHEQRRHFKTIEAGWPKNEGHERLRGCVIELASDIGLGLDLPLYRQAIAHLTKSPRQLVSLKSGASNLGHHEMALLNEDVGIAVTALPDQDEFRLHLSRLLQITTLAGIAWINLKLGEIRFEHLRRVE